MDIIPERPEIGILARCFPTSNGEPRCKGIVGFQKQIADGACVLDVLESVRFPVNVRFLHILNFATAVFVNFTFLHQKCTAHTNHHEEVRSEISKKIEHVDLHALVVHPKAKEHETQHKDYPKEHNQDDDPHSVCL